MSQGYAQRPNLVPVVYADTPDLDAFGRLRTSSPTFVFDQQFTYDLAPLIYEQITNGSGATVAHDSTNRNVLLTFASTPTGGKAFMQSFEHFRYQPGRSQQVFITFNFLSTAADCLKFAGYSDGTNGVELQQDGTTVQLKLYSTTTNGDQTVTQANWNLDKLDGTGTSGKTLDLTKAQILVIDLQALYTGRVRVGFDIGGLLYYVHQFTAANVIIHPYIQTANLPIRCGMTCTGTVSTTMKFVCASVVSEGGQLDELGSAFSVQGSATAASGARTHILSVRPKTTFNSITNRSKFVLDGFEVSNTSATSIIVELVIGQAISGTTTFNDVNSTYSGFEFNTAGTISGSPAIVAFTSYAAGSNKSSTGFFNARDLASKYPIALSAAGTVRALGTISLLVTGIGSQATGVNVAMNWRELR